MSSVSKQNPGTVGHAGDAKAKVRESSSLTADHFRMVCSRFATGVTIAAVIGSDGHPHGMTVNSFSSVSLHPPLVLVSIGRKASVHKHFWTARSFAINVLDESQEELSQRFAKPGSNRFSGIPWGQAATGSPVIEGVLAWLDCEVRERIVAGDHTIYVGQVRQAAAKDGSPLVFFKSGYARIGK